MKDNFDHDDSYSPLEEIVFRSKGMVVVVVVATTGTTTTRVKQMVKESHWRISVNHSLMAFTGNNGPTDHSLLISHSQREAYAVTVKIGGRHEERDVNSTSAGHIPSHTDHTPCDIDLTWFVQHMKVSANDGATSSFECDFSIGRTVAKTPRRNNEMVLVATPCRRGRDNSVAS